MSTILKALKKLEQEKEGQRSDLQRPGADLNTRQVFNKAVRFAWLRRVGARWFLVFFAAMFIGVAGFTLFDKAKKLANRKKVSEQPAQAANQLPGNQVASSAEKTFAKQTSKSRLPASSRQPQAVNAQHQKPVSPTAMTRTGNGDKASLPHAPPPRIKKTRESPLGHGDTLDPKITRPGSPPSSSYLDAKPMTDNRLKVQAIAWSTVAEERMAVVNDRIVHQGDAVDGFIVVAVEPEQVVVREGRQMWAVPFGHD